VYTASPLKWSLIQRVKAALHKLGLTGKVGVAVSGGADSVFLLHVLHELGLAAAVLHVNHKLRGAESDEDETFVHNLAGDLGLPFLVHSDSLPAGNTEQEARRVRYAFFGRQAFPVATGHTLDDQAETVLYRFLRGAGAAGLSGIRPVAHAGGKSGIIRPLLELRREDIRNWLQDRGIAWREDRSNANPDFQRNRIRLRHMPELTATMNPALAETLASTALWAQAEEDYWSAEIARLEPRYLLPATERVFIQTGPFRTLPIAVQRRLLRRGIEKVRGNLRSIDFRHVEAVRALMSTAEGSGRIQLPGLDIYRSFDWLRIAPSGFDARIERNFEAPVVIPGQTRLLAPALTIEAELVDSLHVYTSEVVDFVDWERCAGSLLLRNWRPGDQLHAQVRSGAEKVKTLFQEFRIPLWERRSWPVITRGQAEGSPIVWTRGFGVAKEFAAGPESRKVLAIREVAESNPSFPASYKEKLLELKRALNRWGGRGAEVL
jgi:tRNA(Ile)-lysidine synthase